MYTAAIDGHALNGLFDNQKKLDELFDSIFDDENYFISSASPTLSASKNTHSAYRESSISASKQSKLAERLSTMKNQCPYFYLLPITLEIAAIYFIVTNLV